MSKSWKNFSNNNLTNVEMKGNKKKKKKNNKEFNEEFDEGLNEEYYNSFDVKYEDDIYEVKNKFLNHINKNGLPFYEKECLFNTMYEFIKYNSHNYDMLIKEINKNDQSDDENEYYDYDDY